MVFGHFSEESSPKTYMTTYDLLLFPSWIQVPDALELTTLNIPKTFKEIGFLDNALELQIWSCKVFDPNRHDADNVPIQRSVWLQAYAFKMAKNYNKASSCPHLPWLVDMSATLLLEISRHWQRSLRACGFNRFQRLRFDFTILQGNYPATQLWGIVSDQDVLD